MDMTLTLTAGAALLALAVFAGWRGARPPNPHKGPRLTPWRFIMVTAAALAIALLVHVVNLLGVTTGRGAPLTPTMQMRQLPAMDRSG